MTPDEVLSHPPRILSQAQRKAYFADGYVSVEKLISDDWLERLRAVTADFVARSRAETEPGDVFDIAAGNGAERPKLRRLKEPDARHPVYWDFANDVIADVAADLVGPDVTFHHSKLNFKWHDGGDQVNWHQDIQFYPHTNYSPLAIGTYLEDATEAHGPLAVLPGSQDGVLYDQYDAEGRWIGGLNPEDTAGLDLSRVKLLTGPAGSITVHNCRTVHGSPPSAVADGRPLLLNAYAAADAFPYTPNPARAGHYRAVVRGRPARWACHDPRPCLIPPDWSAGYSSIFAAQASAAAAG
ncbi:MAG: phytanoyl-CoA dioxygenase family protein [Alphaproteobacteria bacterium]|jgi:ectoine hydroxylase-related dioxygenase (phytanoyl-CoA dioxygenase family)|nr:phytanoyl-CoA dioxygenase family protein [Alphaproteobacteria bacterium]MDP6516764.1 phytanoyl-CoA dioxygenase family protein [Alphaproteobacteria bacterium]